MNTRLRLIMLAAVFALLTPSTSTSQAQGPAGTKHIAVPDRTRKCIKPPERAPKPFELFNPLSCLEPVVNVSATTGNQAESFVNVNPTNPNNIVATSNDPGTNSIFRAVRFEQASAERGADANQEGTGQPGIDSSRPFLAACKLHVALGVAIA